MGIARDAQIVCITNVGAKLNRVLAADIRPVVHELILMLAFCQRAVALIHSQRVTKLKIGSPRSMNRESRHGGSCAIQVDAGYAGVFGGCRAKASGRHVHVVARSEEHTSELQSLAYLVCRLLL